MNLSARIESLSQLGVFLAGPSPEQEKLNQYFRAPWEAALQEASLFNPWFTPENLRYAVETWAESLAQEKVQNWAQGYPDLATPVRPKTVAIVMAGNVPLVGLHDLLAVMLSGHKALIKPSSDDNKLMPVLLQILAAINREWTGFLKLAEGKLENFDAVIATGSNNSSRYFEFYFGKYPHIIRKNRSSAALLSGTESKAELQNLGEDVFRYFGLGCRNVSKVYAPLDFDINRIFEAFYSFHPLGNHQKYANNYDYNRAIYLLEKQDFKENGFFIIKENTQLHAPVGVLHLHRYEDDSMLPDLLEAEADERQCLVGSAADPLSEVPFGESQKPGLKDYADGVDTLSFLLNL